MDDLKLTAYHEAGHIVASILMGKPATSATIVPNGEYSGLTKGKGFFEEGFDIESFTLYNIDHYQALKKHIIVNLAGEVATSIISKKRDSHGSLGDWQNTVDWVQHFVFSEHLIDAIANEAEFYLQEIFRYLPVKKLINSYARKLLSKKELNSEEIVQIFENSVCYAFLEPLIC